jgi:DNA-binding XRE family transcriptional regulator
MKVTMKKDAPKVGKPASGLDADVRRDRKGQIVVVLADRVLALRLKAGLTQMGLARAAGIGLNTVVRMEKAGANQGLDSVAAVANALNVAISELLK